MNIKNKVFLGIIPARYASSRLPGKPLAKIGSQTMIERVYKRCSPHFEHLYVATDDSRIFHEVQKFKGNVVMTSTEHESGTDRCLEAYNIISTQLATSFDVVINIQGDEPFIEGESLQLLKDLFLKKNCEMGTLAYRITNREKLKNTGNVYVTKSTGDKALYFSRSLIPNVRDEIQVDLTKTAIFKHIGIYGYTYDALDRFSQMKPSPLELAEKLEQNRFLENDGEIYVAVTPHEAVAVDTSEDLTKARQKIQEP